MWRVKMKGEGSIKGERGTERKDWNQERNTVTIRNQSCNQTCEKYIRTDLLGLCRGRFSLVESICLFVLVIGTHFICHPTHLNPVFQPTLYKFIILGFSSSIIWAKNKIRCLQLIWLINILYYRDYYDFINFDNMD